MDALLFFSRAIPLAENERIEWREKKKEMLLENSNAILFRLNSLLGLANSYSMTPSSQ
jgi:hypothetical protein